MILRRFVLKLSICIIIIVNVDLTCAQTTDPALTATATGLCPPYYEFRNGLCYYIGARRCPEGYQFHTDNLCYPIEHKPCPFENIISTTTASPTTTTTTTQLPPRTSTISTSTVATIFTTTSSPAITITTSSPLSMDEYVRCPPSSIFMEDKCRKVICSLGEYYKGNCLQPACPQGLVWRGKSCQEPGYITTILEIDNVIHNQINEQPILVERSNINKIEYHTTTTTTSRKPYTTRLPTTIRPTRRKHYITTSTTSTTTENNIIGSEDYGCCTVVTPRICKMYGEKWVCFNRRHKRCDSRICTTPIVYLKAPEIKYDPPVLIMPPNPPLNSCVGNNCNNTDIVDCSGCARNHPEHCSSYCYHYMCPKGTCTYMGLDTYCTYYFGQFGCLKEDGCLWNWC